MMAAVFFLVCSGILGFLLLIFHFLFVRDSKKQESIQVITDPTTGKTRKRILEGPFDQGRHDQLYYYGLSLLSYVVFVESLVPLEKSILIEALLSLSKVHPLLRMKCEWKTSNGKTYRYMTEMEKLTLNELNYSEINICKRNWVELQENELKKGFDLSSGPLWRVTRLKQEFDSTSNKYSNTILFTFSHAISDGVSIMCYLDKLLEILDMLFYGDLMEENLEPFPLLEPLPVLLKHNIKLSWIQVLSLKVKHMFQKWLKQSPRNVFLERFPPPVKSNPAIESKTVIQPNCLSVEDTSVFVTNCKLHKCSVGGALAASIAIAVGNLINHEDQRDPSDLQFTIGMPVNARIYCKPVVSNQQLGCYFGIIFIPFSIASEIVCLEDFFWELSRKKSTDIREKISNGEQYAEVKKFRYFGVQVPKTWELAKNDRERAGRYANFALSNIGTYDLDKQRVYKITETYTAVDYSIIGPIITVFAATVSGKLCWNVVHSSRAVSQEVAVDFSEQFSKLIKEIGSHEKK